MGNNDYAPKNHYITKDLIKKEAGKKGFGPDDEALLFFFYEEKIEEMHHQSSSNGKWEIHWIDNERAHSTFLCFYQEIRTLVEEQSLVGIIEKHSQSQIMPLNNTLEYFPMNEQNSFLPLGLVSVA